MQLGCLGWEGWRAAHGLGPRAGRAKNHAFWNLSNVQVGGHVCKQACYGYM